MNLHKRIKQIVALTIEDFYSNGYSTDGTPQSLKSWLIDDISKMDGIEELNTYQISIIVLDKLKSLDLVDLEFIHNTIFEDAKEDEISSTVSFVFEGCSNE